MAGGADVFVMAKEPPSRRLAYGRLIPTAQPEVEGNRLFRFVCPAGKPLVTA
jgi:hypothetical protein